MRNPTVQEHQYIAERQWVGASPRFRAALRQVEIAAPVDCGVLLPRETGTGKELFARAMEKLGASEPKVAMIEIPFFRL